MDSKDDSTKLDQIYRLLALCARAEGHPAFYRELKKQVRAFTAWDELPAQAEIQGMSALFWHHIQGAHIKIPAETQRVFKGLYLRGRAYNQIHEQVLLEILPLFREAGIQPLLLKGLALAYQYYPDPALRPVSDIDLLLKKDDFLPALHALENAKFKLQLPSPALKRLPKSVTAYSPRDGTTVQIELHHYDPEGRHEKANSPDPEFAGFDAEPQAVKINGGILYTSGPMDTLLYLIRHLKMHLFTGNPNIPIRSKWIADIVSLVEYHAEELDWIYIQRHHPDIIHRLEVFYSLTPLPEHLTNIIPIRQVAPPTGINQYPPGWPHQSIRQWKRVGFLKFIKQVFIPPSDWWLRLYYGIREQPLFWYKYYVYPAQVIASIFWVLIHKTGF